MQDVPGGRCDLDTLLIVFFQLRELGCVVVAFSFGRIIS